MRRDARGRSGTAELLAAYVDGVTELSTDERRRLEARLADDASLRDEASELRALLGDLRELPAHASEPDWSALERSIGLAVGPVVPRPWWRRRWRWIVPAFGLVSAAAILALVLHRPDTRATDLPRGLTPSSPEAPIGDTVSLWLDGTAFEVAPSALRALDEIDADLLDDEAAVVGTGDVLEDPGFAFLEDLDDATLERVRQALDEQASPPHRKKS